MNVGLQESPFSRVHELVGNTSLDNHNFARSDIYRSCSNGELGLALVYDKDLLGWVPMETRPAAWRYIDE